MCGGAGYAVVFQKSVGDGAIVCEALRLEGDVLSERLERVRQGEKVCGVVKVFGDASEESFGGVKEGYVCVAFLGVVVGSVVT